MHFHWYSLVLFAILAVIDGAKEQNKSLKRKIYNMTKRSDFNRTRKTLLSRICFHNNWRDNIIYSDDFLTWWFSQSFTCIVWKTALVIFSNTRACPWWMYFWWPLLYIWLIYLNCKELIKYCYYYYLYTLKQNFQHIINSSLSNKTNVPGSSFW